MRSFEVPDAVSYGGGLTGIGINVLVAIPDWSALLVFVQEVLQLPLATVGDNFAILRHEGIDMMLHRDDTYGSNPGAQTERDRTSTGGGTRGLGVEVRIYNVAPAEVEARAREAGHVVLQSTTKKPHGLLECYIQGPGGYVWVPSCPTPAAL